MPDPRGTAVEVWRFRWNTLKSEYSERPSAWRTARKEPGVWRSQADDALLMGVVEAARAISLMSGPDSVGALIAALDALAGSGDGAS